MATYLNPSVTFKKLHMILCMSSDSFYLSVSQSRTRVGGYHFLGNKYNSNTPLGNQQININAPIHAEAIMLRAIMGTVSESEITVACANSMLGVNHRIKLMEMGHTQQATPLEMENATAHGVLTKQLTPKISKAIDMRFYWLRYRNNQHQFHLH